MDLFRKIVRDIKSIKIQGATNVAKSAVKAFLWKAKKIRAKNRVEYLGKLEHFKQILFETRPTEPLMRNVLKYIINTLKKSDLESKKEMLDLIELAAAEFLFNLKEANERIAEIGCRIIKDNSTVFTHCHSSTVINILRKAKAEKKKFRVICTETRPLFQGHITAKELASAKIPVTLIVDSAISTYIKKANISIVGADVIDSRMGIVNKIGTLYLALASKRVNIPFFCATTIMKFDPETTLGSFEKIEMRDPKEVWKNPPRGVNILNPAFDYTPRNLINAFITEEGIFSPESLFSVINERYKWLMRL